MTNGKPLFCASCGRTYDVKLCSRLHTNPRSAEVCSQCGSRDLSTPQPRVPIRWKLLEVFMRTLLLVFLIGASLVVLIEFLEGVLTSPQVQSGLIVIGLLVAVLWWMWGMLPHWFKKAVTEYMKRKRRNTHGE